MEQVSNNVMELWTTQSLLWSIIAEVFIIAFIGFFRSVAQNHQPSYLWNQKEFLSKLISTGNSFAALLTPLFALFGFLYNLVVWFIYGVTTIFDGLIWLILWLWKWFVFICRWVFENIIDPGFFFIIKLIWRYLFVWTWYFIKTSFEHLRIKFSFKVYIIAFIGSTVTGFVILLCLIFLPELLPIGVILGIIITSFFASRILAELLNDYQKSWSFSILRKTTTWFLLTIGILALIAIVNYLVYGSFLQISLFGVNMGITSFLGIGLLFFLILFSFSLSMLPAHIYYYKGEITELTFINEIGRNFLKYIFSAPFTLLPLCIIMLIPTIITWGVYEGSENLKNQTLNLKRESISKNLEEKKTFMASWLETAEYTPVFDKESESLACKIAKKEQRLNEIGLLSNPFVTLITEGKTNYQSSANIDEIIAEIESLIQKTDTDIMFTKEQIQIESTTISEIDSLRSLILPVGITTRKEPVMVGNYKKFGVPSVSGTNSYVWRVFEGNSARVRIRRVTRNNLISLAFDKAGNYTLEVIPINDCGENASEKQTVHFEVSPKPKSIIVQKPNGPSEVCYGTDATFTAKGGYNNYRFNFPDQVTVLWQNRNSIRVKWGNTSGGISYTASDWEGSILTSKKHYVSVSAKPGIDVKSEPSSSDVSEPKLPSEPFIYCTIEEADASINDHLQSRTNLKSILSQLLNIKANQVTQKHTLTSERNVICWFNVKYTIGLVLLSLVFSSLFALILMFTMIYITRYNFFLYSYKRDGAFYIVSQYDQYHRKNPNQPLLGLILLPLLIFVVLFFVKFSYISDIWIYLTGLFNV